MLLKFLLFILRFFMLLSYGFWVHYCTLILFIQIHILWIRQKNVLNDWWLLKWYKVKIAFQCWWRIQNAIYDHNYLWVAQYLMIEDIIVLNVYWGIEMKNSFYFAMLTIFTSTRQLSLRWNEHTTFLFIRILTLWTIETFEYIISYELT